MESDIRSDEQSHCLGWPGMAQEQPVSLLQVGRELRVTRDSTAGP